MPTHTSFVIVDDPSSSWSLNWSRTHLLPQGHRIMQLPASFRHLSRAESKAPNAHMSFPVQASPQKGEAVPAEHHSLLGQRFHIKDKKVGQRLCLATDILQMPVLVLWTALLSQEQVSDIHSWTGTVWWWFFPSMSTPSPRCFMLLF